jgi:hydroxymethylpyrimidine/phosphomethylpyrimidine kinase
MTLEKEPAPRRERMRLLIVAGHDASGGAGVDADRASVRRLPIEPVSIVTAWTDQDDREVRSIGARPPEDWLREARAACAQPIAAVKIGLLPGRDHVHAASELIRDVHSLHGEWVPIVVDPVLASSSGTRFLDEAATDALLAEIASANVILTPNLVEAAELTGASLAEIATSLPTRIRAARVLLSHGCAAVVIKGGHSRENPVRDLVATRDGRLSWLRHQRVTGGKIRGSGCRFATRLAAELALGRTLEASGRVAGRHVARLILAHARR